VRLTRDPPQDRTPFAQFYKVPIEFGALTAGVIFDAAALDWPVRDRNPDYAKILAPLLEDAVADAEGDFVLGRQVGHAHADRCWVANARRRLPCSRA